MNDQSVSLAAIGLAVTAVGAVVYVVKYLAETLSSDLKEHTKAATELTQAAKEQKNASNEVLTFMKRLNGTLPRSVEEKQAIKNKETA